MRPATLSLSQTQDAGFGMETGPSLTTELMNISKTICTWAVAFLALLPVSWAIEPDPELVYHLTNRLANFDSRNVSRETRERFIEQLRDMRNNEGMRFKYSGIFVDYMSLELGDTDYIEQSYDEWLSRSTYLKRTGLNLFRRSRNPEFVGRFIKHLERDTPKTLVRDLEMWEELGLQRMLASTVLAQLHNCPHFNSTTRDWARSQPYSGSGPLLHEFWEHNKERFEAKDYGAIYPPGMEPPPATARDVPAIAMQLKDRSSAKGNNGENPRSAIAPLESPLVGQDETAPARAKPKTIADDGSPILLLLLVFMTGGAIWFFLRRQ
jgi:hypothetical protein